MSARVLIVEDQKELAELLAHNLRLDGLEVRVSLDGNHAIATVAEWLPDLVLLDLMLPGKDGYEVLRHIRSKSHDPTVIILSARSEEQDKIRGFRLDADQYVTKPFSLPELLERVHALLRNRAARTAGANGAAPIVFGDVEVDTEARTVHRQGQDISLTPKAFDLLLALIQRSGRVASRVELLREVWGYGPLVLSRTVDSHIVELRRKLEEDASEPRHILTVYKAGYRFEA